MNKTTRPGRPTHDCPCGCGEQIPQHRLSCKTSWFTLPKPLRERITRTFRRDRTEHHRAVLEALQFLAPDPNGSAPA